MPSYVLSPAAQSSLRHIKAWSINRFGKETTSSYLGRLRQKMCELAKQPLLGTPRPELKEGYYSAFSGSHTIYYRIVKTGIEVIDVLHQRMEPELHL